MPCHNHGGPYPASSNGRSTSLGILRFSGLRGPLLSGVSQGCVARRTERFQSVRDLADGRRHMTREATLPAPSAQKQ